jgi:hypothetical protein
MEVCRRKLSIDSYGNVRIVFLKAVSIKITASWNAMVYALKMEAASFFEILFNICQAEVYIIKACAVECLGRDYRNRNMYILSDNEAAIKALDYYQIYSQLVWDAL